MAGLMGDEMACHGASIQDDDCCFTSGDAEQAMIVPVISATALTVDDGASAPLAVISEESLSVARAAAQPTPLYRLFRSLLI